MTTETAPSIGHNSGANGDTAQRIRQIIAEVESSNARMDSEREHCKEIYAKAKSDGLPVDAIKKHVTERKKGAEKVKQLDGDLDLVRAVMGWSN